MTQTETKNIQEAIALTKEIEALLPSGFKISSISTTAKIPFKAHSWCGAILHRAFELATSSIKFYESGNFITSSIISLGSRTKFGNVSQPRKRSCLLFSREFRIPNTVVHLPLGASYQCLIMEEAQISNGSLLSFVTSPWERSCHFFVLRTKTWNSGATK